MNSFSAVVTTGIYCLPSCQAQPQARHVRRYPLAAAAEAAGYRACFRCRPYRTQPSAHLPAPALVCRAVQIILDGALDGQTEGDLAAHLGYSARHLRRLFVEHLGVTPDQLARSARTHFARRLLDDTDFTITEVASAAGFGSIRQLNRACREVFWETPVRLRDRRRASDRLVTDGGLALRLPYQAPLDWDAPLAYLRRRAIPGVEQVSGRTYRRTVCIAGDPGVIELAPGGPADVVLRAHLPHWEGLTHLAQRARRVFNLDGDIGGAAAHLAADPLVGPLLRARPGLRPPGTWAPLEVGVWAIAAHEGGPATANAIAARMVERYGTAVAGLRDWGLTHLFPSARTLATADLGDVGLSRSGSATINAFAQAVADHAVHLDHAGGLETLTRSLTTVPGVGAGVADYLAWRMGEPDAWPGPAAAAAAWAARRPLAGEGAERWRPWRAYAAMQLLVATACGGEPDAPCYGERP